jgi:hypothetical protein
LIPSAIEELGVEVEVEDGRRRRVITLAERREAIRTITTALPISGVIEVEVDVVAPALSNWVGTMPLINISRPGEMTDSAVVVDRDGLVMIE